MSASPAGGRGDRRLAVALAVFAVVALLAYRDAVLGKLLAGLSMWTAGAAHAALGGLGIDAVRDGAVLYRPGGFAVEVYYRCTGVLPAAFLATVVLASRAGWRRRLLGVATLVPLVGALNLLRLVHLFALGAARPELFDFAHRVVWEGAMLVAVLGLWQAWDRWVGAASGARRPAGDAIAPA